MKDQNLENAKIFFEKGLKFFQQENYKQAEHFFLESLKLAPGRLSVIRNLIAIYVKNNQKKKLDQFLESNKRLYNEKEVLFGFAFNFFYKKNYKKSIELCKKLLIYKEFKNSIEDLLASNYKKNKNFLKALKIYKNKLKKEKNYLTYYNIGNLFSDIGRVQTAYYYFKKSLKLKNDNSTLWNISLSALKLKNFKEGFDLYENRWNKKDNPGEKKFTQIPLLTSLDEIKNKKILIWDEQGLGDTLQFSRFVIDLAFYSKNITFVVNKKLSKILKKLNNHISVTDYDNLGLQNFDYQLPLFSLPKLLKVNSINQINYHKLSLPILNDFQIELKGEFKIGIAWSGNPDYSLDEYRSIPFQYLQNLFKIEGVNFYKLSQNIRNDEFIDFNSLRNLNDFGEKSLFEISQLLEKFDLVISSDTSIIHLAGILNIKSILLLNFNSDWRWFDQTENTIWYPSVKIIKQKKINDWESVVTRLVKEVSLIINKKKGQ